MMDGGLFFWKGRGVKEGEYKERKRKKEKKRKKTEALRGGKKNEGIHLLVIDG